jgi:hypothetical protein
LGDIDLDGFPDLIFNVQYTDGKTIQKAVVLHNQGCTKERIDALKAKYAKFDEKKCRDFVSSDLTKQLEVLTTDTSYLTTFFDWAEMG